MAAEKIEGGGRVAVNFNLGVGVCVGGGVGVCVCEGGGVCLLYALAVHV